MKSKIQKKKELNALKDGLSRSKITVFTSFAREGEKGLNVSALRGLKKDLRSVNSEYFVEKKTLLNKALSESNKKVDIFQYPGSMGVVFGYGDEMAAAKSVYNFAKKNSALKYFGALFGDEFMDMAEFTEFAKLPGREILLAHLLGMMKYPLLSFVSVLSQIAKKNETAPQS